MATWPGTLPDFWNASGYKETDADVIIKSNMSAGPPKRRRRTTAGLRQVSGTMNLTETEYNTMRTFFNTDCAGGAITFTMDDPHGNNRTFYWAKPPSFSYLGHNDGNYWWSCSLQLEERY